MPRRKRTTVRTVAVGPSDAARHELRAQIDDVLTFANKHVANAWVESEAAYRSMGDAIHRVLTAVSVGGSAGFSGWPEWAALGVSNIRALLTTGGYYLRRCRECDLWFLVHHRRRVRCNRPACRKAASRQRTAAARRREFEQQRRARALARMK